MVLTYPDQQLISLCSDVTSFDVSLHVIVSDMQRTMYEQSGIGLAAPQIGITKRLIVIDHTSGNSANQFHVMINPRVTWVSKNLISNPEGCLSLPGVMLDVLRHDTITVVYDDVAGNRQEVFLDGLKARIVQHEIDHLDGILIIDRVSVLKRKLALKELRRKNEDYA